MNKALRAFLPAWFSMGLTCAGQTAARPELRELDGLPLTVSEADFVRERPQAQRMKGSRDDPRSRRFIYLPTGVTLFGRPVATVGRGFESGRGCAAGVSFGAMGAPELSVLLADMSRAFGGVVSRHTDSSGNKWVYFSLPEYVGSATASAPSSDSAQQDVTLIWSSTQCEPAIAAARWQTRPR